MIEINLLPEELRQTEGTPPARLAAIIVGVVVACGIGVMIGKRYLVDIPVMQSEIKNRESEITNLKKKEQDVKNTIAQIETLKAKVATLDNLIQSRIRYSRLLDRLCDAVPDGVWFKSFNVLPDNAPPPPGTLPGGKRYMISLTGYTTGKDALEQNARLTTLMNNLDNWFRVVDVDPKTGINRRLGARFKQPHLIGANWGPVPQPVEKDPKVLKALDAPKDGLDFSMTLGFELPQKPPG